MSEKKDTGLATRAALRDPFALLRQFTSELDQVFDRRFAGFHWPSFTAIPDAVNWAPQIDVIERDHQLVTKVDLPGLKKEDIKVEVTDGYLAISGERKSESEEKKDNVVRRERSYGSFYRAVPLPDGVKINDVKATFGDGVLEVSVPLSAKAEAAPRAVTIEEPAKPKAAA